MAKKTTKKAAAKRPRVASKAFSFDRFVELGETALVAYAEEILHGPTRVKKADAERLAARLTSFDDEYHLVYAIELVSYLQPPHFASRLIPLLGSRFQSVRLATHRALSRLPPRLISDKLIEDVEVAVRTGAYGAELGGIVKLLTEMKALSKLRSAVRARPARQPKGK